MPGRVYVYVQNAGHIAEAALLELLRQFRGHDGFRTVAKFVRAKDAPSAYVNIVAALACELIAQCCQNRNLRPPFPTSEEVAIASALAPWAEGITVDLVLKDLSDTRSDWQVSMLSATTSMYQNNALFVEDFVQATADGACFAVGSLVAQSRSVRLTLPAACSLSGPHPCVTSPTCACAL